MGRGEHGGILHPDAGQRRDREEPPVVQLGIAAGEVHQLVVLPVVHRIWIVARHPRPRREREPVLEVAQLTILHTQRRIVTEHGHDDPAPAPVNVEPVRVRRLPAEPQHVPPRRVLGGHLDPEVVRHDVDHDAEPGILGRRPQGAQTFLTTAVGVHPGHVCRVVPVWRSGRGLEQRGQVDRTHAELAQVVDQIGGVAEGEVAVDLQPVRRGRDRHPSTLPTRLLRSRPAPVAIGWWHPTLGGSGGIPPGLNTAPESGNLILQGEHHRDPG
jgi:hypothetical protein